MYVSIHEDPFKIEFNVTGNGNKKETDERGVIFNIFTSFSNISVALEERFAVEYDKLCTAQQRKALGELRVKLRLVSQTKLAATSSETSYSMLVICWMEVLNSLNTAVYTQVWRRVEQ